MIYISILIPIAATIIVSVRKNWDWRYFLSYFAATVILSVLIGCLCYYLGTRQDYFNEVWNYKILKVQYYEPWNERVSCRHPKYRTETYTTSDSKGRVSVHTRQVFVGYEHSYDVDYHLAHYDAVDEYAQSWNINSEIYEYWKKNWANNVFVDMNRRYHTIDGDMYESKFTGQFELIYPKEEIRSYQNKIRVSNSVFKTKEASKEVKKKYYRPVDVCEDIAVLSYDGAIVLDNENWIMRQLNAELGPKYKIHILTILWGEHDSEIMNQVLDAWGGPNKNELVIAIGADKDRKVRWCQVYSWCDDTTVHSIVRQDVNEMGKLDFKALKDKLLEEIPKYWKKKSFKDFNYINNPLPVWCYILNIFLSSGICIGIFFLVDKYERDNIGYNAYCWSYHSKR